MSAATSNTVNVGWTAEPDGRGTWTLLFNCVSTTLICTWSALHLNVLQGREENPGVLSTRITFFVLALAAPEYFVTIAIREWEYARDLTKKIKDRYPNTTWSMLHSHLVIMRGVKIIKRDGAIIRIPSTLKSEECLQFHDDLLSSESFSAEYIADKSKADWFTRIIASLQIIWFLTQIVGRVASDLTITPLELFTLGYVGCALGMYYFWRHKPFDLQVPITVTVIVRSSASVTSPDARNRSNERRSTRRRSESGDAGFLPNDKSGHYNTRVRRSGSIPGISNSKRKKLLWVSRNQSMLVSLIFFTFLVSACHLLGWKYPFSTIIEAWLWRVCSLLSLGLPLLIIFVQITYWQLDEEARESVFKNVEAFTVLCALLYFSVRTCLLVQVFLALRSVPVDVFDTVEWAQYMPHI